MYLSIVIPAWNEEKRIGSTLGSIADWLATQDFDAEIVVVDNRSTDNTTGVVREWMPKLPYLRLVHEKKGGKGYAVQTGMLFATGQVRLFMDSDNATTIDHFDRCRPYLDQGYDVVIGSLGVRGAKVIGHGEPGWRQLLGKMGNLWIQLWAVPGVWDTQRGFKVFTAQATQAIFPNLTIFGWGFDIEVLALARLRGFKIKEIPVNWVHDPNSRVKFWDYPKTLLETLKVPLNRLRGKYRLSHGS